jgi:hypothetical protein
MFIANRLVPQHKDFLDEHGYEFREIGETDFERRLAECRARTHEPPLEKVEVVSTPGVLPPATCELHYEIETQSMTMCYKMLLLILLAELADASGRVPLTLLAERFHAFFVARAAQKKLEENPKRVRPDTLSTRSVQAWKGVVPARINTHRQSATRRSEVG